MTVTVNTNEYESTHGKAPKGQGHWAFQFYKVGVGHTIEFAPTAMFVYGPLAGTYARSIDYAAAKKWAIKRAKEIGADRVAVAT